MPLERLGCSRKARSCDDHFIVNFGGNVKAGIKLIEKIKTAEFGQNN
jgi:hypothetical protein